MDMHAFLIEHLWLVLALWVLWGIGFAMVYRWISWRRGSRLIQDWATVHHFVIVSMHQPIIVPLWREGRGRQYIRATLRDTSGQVRDCWLCYPTLALAWFDKAVNHIEVIWDDKSSDQPTASLQR
jgi:hypothetical protein